MAEPLARLRIELEADSASLEEGLKQASRALQRAAAIGAAVGGVIANVALRIADSFASAVRDVVSGISDVTAASQQLGMPVEALSRLRFAAESVGVGFATLRDGMSTLANNISEAASNASSEAARAFEAMGVAVREANGDVRDVDDVLRDVAERFSTYEDGANKAALATALFGSRAHDLTPLLDEGAAGIDALGRQADETGNVVSGNTARAFASLSEAAAEASNVMSGIATRLVGAVAPAFASMVDSVRNAWSGFGDLDVVMTIVNVTFTKLMQAVMLVNGALREVGAVIAGVVRAMKAMFDLDWDGVREALASIGSGFGDAMGRAIADVEALGRGIGVWSTETTRATEAMAPTIEALTSMADAMKEVNRLIAERTRLLLADPGAAYADKLREIEYAETSGAISAAKAGEMRRKAWEIEVRAAETAFQAVGRGLSALFNKSKPAAIAEATINTLVGITQALRSGPYPWNLINAAAVGAMGFAQVRNIMSTSESGGGAASVSTPAAGDAAVAPSQMLTVEGLSGDGLMSMLSVRSLIERINDATANGATLVLR